MRIDCVRGEIGVGTRLSAEWNKFQFSPPQIEKYHSLGAKDSHLKILPFKISSTCAGNSDNRTVGHAYIDGIINVQFGAVIVEACEDFCRPRACEESEVCGRMADLSINLAATRQFWIAIGSRAGMHIAVSYTHLRAHETGSNLVCRLLLEK